MNSASNIESWVQSEARGLYRWEWEVGWPEEPEGLCEFEQGDAIKIDPFPDLLVNSDCLNPVYAEFVEYVTDDITKVYIPREGDGNTWFGGDEGMYLIHQGYLTPQ